MKIEKACLDDVYDSYLAQGVQTPRRLLFIAYQFAPSIEMGARSCAQIARYLPLYGWSPVVLTANEKYIEDRFRGRDDEIAELGLTDSIVKAGMLPHPFDFYRWLRSALRRKPKSGDCANDVGTMVEIETPLHEKGKLRRLMLSALGVPDKYTGWILPAVVAGLKAARKTKAHQLLSSGPCWTNHLVGLVLSYLTGLPWTAHFRDPWITGACGIPIDDDISVRLNKWIERLVVTRATAVVVVTDEHAAAFRQTYPKLSPDKFSVVTNGYDDREWGDLPTNIQRDENSKGKLLITYTGKFYIGRDPQPLFRALKRLIDSREVTPEQVQVDLIGWCETSMGRSVREMVIEYGLGDCVNILGVRNRTETLRRMTHADLLLLLGEGLDMVIPGKTFEYLRAGRPILALTPEGSLANLLRRTGGGWVVDPNDDAGVLAAVRERFYQWKEGQATRVADPETVAGYDRRALTGRLAGLFDRLG